MGTRGTEAKGQGWCPAGTWSLARGLQLAELGDLVLGDDGHVPPEVHILALFQLHVHLAGSMRDEEGAKLQAKASGPKQGRGLMCEDQGQSGGVIKARARTGAGIRGRAGPSQSGYLDVLQQVLHVGHREPIEECVGLMHLNRQVIILGADVLGQQVDGFGSPIPDANLGAAGEGGRW